VPPKGIGWNSVCCPVVSSLSGLFTVNLNSDIRTGDRAQGAPRAFPHLALETDRAVPSGIVFVGGGDQPLFACMDAKMAFLAKFLVNDDMSLQIFCLLIQRISMGTSDGLRSRVASSTSIYWKE
jgi:hypothetical protein